MNELYTTYRADKFKAVDTEVSVYLSVIGFGTDNFKYEIVYDLFSAEVHYDIKGNRTIQPMVEGYEPEEIESWYPEYLAEIEKYHNIHKIELFDTLVNKLNDIQKRTLHTVKYMKSEMEK